MIGLSVASQSGVRPLLQSLLADRRGRRAFTIVLAASVIRGALAVPIPFLGARLFDEAVTSGETSSIIAAGLAFFALLAAGSGADVAIRRFAHKHVTTSTCNRRVSLMEHAFALAPDSSRSLGRAGLYDAVGTNVARVERATSGLLVNLLPSLVLTALLGAVTLVIEWRLAALSALLVPVLIVVSARLAGRTRRAWASHHNAWRDYNEFVQRSERMAALTRASSAEVQQLSEHKILAREVESTAYAAQAANTDFTGVMRTLAAAASLVALVTGGLMVADDTLDIADLVAFTAAVSLLRAPIHRIVEAIPGIAEGQAAETHLEELEELEPMGHTTSATRRRIDFSGQVTARGIEFAYGDSPLFAPVDLTLTPGEVTVVCGPNGVGKSTLASLVLGLRAPSTGELVADGVPYEQLDLHHLRRGMAVLLQEMMVDEGTVAEVLSFGLPDVDRDILIAAAETANALSVIESLPDGLDTVIGRRGIDLSLGQYQRLSIARALARSPRLLILDEPTNHLDPASVRAVLDNLKKVEPTCSMLVLGHHSDLLPWADRVIELRPAETSEEP